MNRMGCGYSRTTWQQMLAQGGADGLVRAPAAPASVPEHAPPPAHQAWFPARSTTARPCDGPTASRGPDTGPGSTPATSATTRALRRIYSDRQVLETMVDFWSNHLHVPLHVHHAGWLRWEYDQTIRKHALGRFEDLLVAARLHPAMLLYLDNASRCAVARTRTRAVSCSSCTPSAATSGYTEHDGQGLRQDPVRLHRRRDAPAGPTTTRARTPPGRSRCSASATPTRPPTARTLTGRLPEATSPTTPRPRGSSRSGSPCASCPTRPSDELVEPPREGVHRQRHRHRGDAAGARRPPGVRGARPA